MGATAEFLVQKYNFTREQQDEVALRSNNMAEQATNAGKFKVCSRVLVFFFICFHSMSAVTNV